MSSKMDAFDKSLQSNIRRNAREYCNQEISKLELLSSKVRWWAWFFVVVGALAGAAGLWSLVSAGNNWYGISNLGNLGSYLQGAVASLLSLSALLFVYTAYLAQRMEFYLQGVMLQEQKEQFQKQQDSINRQTFESSFFQLLNLQNQISAQLQGTFLKLVKREFNLAREEKGIEGKACFQEFYELLWKKYQLIKSHNQLLMSQNLGNFVEQKSEPQLAVEAYQEVYSIHQNNLGHFFRNLYHVFKFVDDSDIDDKKRYTSLARAQLSQCELVLLFYNGLTIFPPEKKNKFKPLIEKFSLLENLDIKLLLDPSHRTNLYLESAFESHDISAT